LTDRNLIELNLLSGLVEEYEDEHYPIKTPSLADVIKLRMYEMGINQTKLSELLGVSPSRISDYLTGRSEPTLKVAREISRKLNIDANIVLGVQNISIEMSGGDIIQSVLIGLSSNRLRKFRKMYNL
jgi:HTH-type transcriptional regulator/antitoxin HigA